ncbi:MAG: guanylate kinase [Candidatus Omnitrophica bacterium]|nr:guanylate kinase [Candidatus Omnitrophota bacterium]
MKHEPLILIISAPSGAGKTTIANKILKDDPDIKQTVSYTTRTPRTGEKNGREYFFISDEDFKKKIENKEFLEWEENFGKYYGTLKKQAEDILAGGKDVLLSIDVKGGKTVKAAYPASVSVFIMPPSVEALETRLTGRNTEKNEEIRRRLKEAEREIKAAEEYDYLLVNEDLDKAVAELKTIIKTERTNRKNA